MNNFSLWEQESFLQCDYAIVGGGFTGLSLAIELQQHQPQAQVVVLEKDPWPAGASAKNAGFACFGSLTEILDDAEQMGQATALALVEKRWAGLQILKARLGMAAMGYQPCGGYETLSEEQLPALEKRETANQWLQPLLGQQVFQDASAKIGAFGFNPEKVKALLFNPLEGSIHTGQTLRALWQKAASLGVLLYGGAEVQRLETESGRALLQVQTAAGACSLRAGQAAVCTNAFTGRFLPNADLVPGRGLVLVTKPLAKGLPFGGVFHYDRGYVYFRPVGRRLLLGGGRHLDKSGEQTTEAGINPRIKAYLEALLFQDLLPGDRAEIDYYWSGPMAFGQSKMPILRQEGPYTFAVRMGGMGVAMASQVARQAAEQVLAGKATSLPAE